MSQASRQVSQPQPDVAPPIWSLDADAALDRLGSGRAGLTGADAAARLARYGPNSIAGAGRSDDLALLAKQFSSPIVLILILATVLSGVLGDWTDALIILAIIVLSSLLGFWQERGATRAVQALLAVVRVQAEVRRDGRLAEVALVEIVPGDVVELKAGDVAPGDCLVLESNALLVDEAALTGETFPVEKAPAVLAADTPLAKRTNALFLGTHVVSGQGAALVASTGSRTEFGRLSAKLRQRPTTTGFERGMTAFGQLLLRAMIVLVAAIFVVNVVLARPLIDAALFSLALAVGLTPQLLPTIVTISLSQGARLMARRRVIVKRLDAIEDFGAMTILCTDKTGTMTVGAVGLQAALDLNGATSPAVLHLAWLNSRLQTGFANPIDQAILAAAPAAVSGARRVAELPYDFSRRRLSVLVDEGGQRLLVTKGAFDSVMAVCTSARAGAGGGSVPLAAVRSALTARYEALGQQGYRVLGLATREFAGERLTGADEADLTLVGLLTFLDPPKPEAAAALHDLAAAGISVRMITGDNRLAAAHVGGLVGLDASSVLAGTDVADLDDTELARRAATTQIFAEIDPIAKERIIRALRADGSVVGYMGDGINDAPALHAADVGISVDSAVDVAKQAAAIVLLDKDLRVLLEGVGQGRRTFANTLKYVFTTTSANFGNVLSMAVASAVLPFLPLLAGQILLINFLTDFPATTIATDEVDPEQLAAPHGWDLRFVRNFMLLFGGISSLFDLATFAVMRLGFNADEALFRSAWFVESVLTELAVLFVLRTSRRFFQSRPSRLLAASSAAVALLTLAIIYSPLAPPLGLLALPLSVLAALTVITAAYVGLTELAKDAYYAGSEPARAAERPAG